jgi:hypothetical protein
MISIDNTGVMLYFEGMIPSISRYLYFGQPKLNRERAGV